MFQLLNSYRVDNYLKAYGVAPLILLNQKNEIETTALMLQLNQDANIIMPLIFLWVFFGLFMLFNVFFSFAAILLITEAAMLTLILLLAIILTSYFPNITADILNLLNASAMEAIIGITIVFVHQKSWKSRYTNSMENVLESSWFSTYLYLIYFGHLSWSIIKIIAVVIYCGIRSIFKLAVKIGIPVILKLLETTQGWIEWFIFFWMTWYRHQIGYIRVVNVNYIFFEKTIKYDWSKLYYFMIIWDKINILSRKIKECEKWVRGYFLRKEDQEVEEYQKIKKERNIRANQAINAVKMPSTQVRTYARGPSKVNNIHKISRRKKHTKKISGSKIIKYILYVRKEKKNIQKLKYLNPTNSNLKLTSPIIILGNIVLIICVYFYFSYVVVLENKIDVSNIDTFFYWNETKNITLDVENGIKNFKIGIKRINQPTPLEKVNLLISKNKLLKRLSNISMQSFLNFGTLNPKDIIIDIKKITLNQKNREKIIDSLEENNGIWHIIETQKNQINKLNPKNKNEVKFEVDLLGIKFQNNILKKRYNNKNHNYSYIASNFWGKINIEEKLEKQITSIANLSLDSKDRSKIREKLLNMAVWQNKLMSPINIFIEKTTQIRGKEEIYNINYLKNIDLLEDKTKINFNENSKLVLIKSLWNNTIYTKQNYFDSVKFITNNVTTNKIKQKNITIRDNNLLYIINLFKSFKINSVRPLGTKYDIFHYLPINLKENIEIYTCYTKPKEKLNWSAKNWDSIFTYSSKLLPWYENAEIEDDVILDDSEGSGGEQEMILSQKLKENLLEEQIKEIDEQTKELNIRNLSIPVLYNLNKNSVVLKNISINTEILENLEISYKRFGTKLEGLAVSQKLSIWRKPLPFPIMSPRAINNLTTDTLFNVNGTIYSKGSGQTPLTIVNVENIETEERINLLKSHIRNQKQKRLFSFSTLDVKSKKSIELDLSLLGGNSNFDKYTKVGLNQNLKNVIFDLEKLNQNVNQTLISSLDGSDSDIDTNYIYNIFRFQNLNKTKTKIKTLINGNTPKINHVFYSRKRDILNNRKIVEDRMVKPVKDIVYSRVVSCYERISPSVPIKRIALNDVMLFIEKNDRFREKPNITKMKQVYEKMNYDSLLGITSKLKDDKKVFFDDDFEIDIDRVRTTATQPHSLYGLMWDEYLKQSYNVSLQFINFNNKFEDYYKNELKVINFNYDDNLEKALTSDLRYSFGLNDEIKNTLINRMLPKIGYFTELNNPSMQYLNFQQKQKKNTLLFLKEKFYTGRIYKKKLKKYIAQRIKYSEKPIGFKYDQQPHQIKLPYRKKLLWIRHGVENQPSNFGFVTNKYLKKKNQTEWVGSRYKQTLPYSGNYFKLPIVVKKNHKLPIYIFKGHQYIDYFKKKNEYSLDKFKNGVEYFSSVKNQTKNNQNLIYRLGILKNNEIFTDSVGYLMDNSKTGVWKKKKQKMRIKKNMRIFTKYFLHGMSIFETRGTNKYQNDKYTFKLIDSYRLTHQKNNRRFDIFSDYTQPIVGLYRSGDIENEKNAKRENYLKTLRFNFLVNTNIVNTPIIDQLDNFRFKSLAKNFYNNSLKFPQNQQENQIYSLEFYSDVISQEQNYEENWGVFNGGVLNIIKDNSEFFNENMLGFTEYSENILTFANLEENNLIFSELGIARGTGPSNSTRNFYTYFSTNLWDIDDKIKVQTTKMFTTLKPSINITRKNKIKILALILKLDKYLIAIESIVYKTIKKLFKYVFYKNNNSIDSNKNLIKYKQIISVWEVNVQLFLFWILFSIF